MSDRAKPWLVDGPALDPKLLAMLDGAGRDAFAHVLLHAAAPALARALCRVEFGDTVSRFAGTQYGGGALLESCPSCLGDGRHAFDCPIDDALTAAGLTAADRAEVRRG